MSDSMIPMPRIQGSQQFPAMLHGMSGWDPRPVEVMAVVGPYAMIRINDNFPFVVDLSDLTFDTRNPQPAGVLPAK